MDESEAVARGWVFFAAFFCGVLAHFAALCILVFMPLQRSQLSFCLWQDMLMSSGAVTWIQGFFLQPFLVAFFVHLEGDPFTTFVLRYDLHGVAIGLPTVTRCLQVAGTPSTNKQIKNMCIYRERDRWSQDGALHNLATGL